MLIRETTLDDIVQIDQVRSASLPWHAASVAAQRIWFSTQPAGARGLRLCAEIDGQVVATAMGGLEVHAVEPGMATAGVTVHPDHRGRGVGGQLHARLEEHLRQVGAHRIQTNALDDPDILAWATRRGYEPGATTRYLRVDPRNLPPVPPVPPGVTVQRAAESGPEPLYAVDNLAFLDEPGDVPSAGMPYDDWLSQFWQTVDQEVSMVAFVDGVPAAVTLVGVNATTGRAMSQGSGTLREYRGRGLMKLLKSMSLRRAAELGITAAITVNDETNEPMLAVNQWLGYQHFGTGRSLLKRL